MFSNAQPEPLLPVSPPGPEQIYKYLWKMYCFNQQKQNRARMRHNIKTANARQRIENNNDIQKMQYSKVPEILVVVLIMLTKDVFVTHCTVAFKATVSAQYSVILLKAYYPVTGMNYSLTTVKLIDCSFTHIATNVENKMM